MICVLSGVISPVGSVSNEGLKNNARPIQRSLVNDVVIEQESTVKTQFIGTLIAFSIMSCNKR